MNCWRSINFRKEYGLSRLYSMSILIGASAFIFLYVPLSITHGELGMHKAGFIPFIVAIILLPSIHTFAHALPLLMSAKRVKIKGKTKKFMTPIIACHPCSHLSKQLSLLTTIAPTLLVTLPGIIVCYSLTNFEVYILIFTAAHIALSFSDFIYLYHTLKAPKHAWIENDDDGFAILVKNKK